ncbi:MAG: tRNA (adenosine(37)-N6)-threonylcarbamoyltransferase complex transferase subunit TsaD [Candidatus Dojkabacteria bacterium]|nr:tRNA (adenosine(37)-N6)-threonylcarbamoyltransferase complex transferase subunit TsaD [Candidatus Dojkabacteria bacterium]
MKDKLILGIDTSCDDTSVAVLDGRKVLSSAISSQLEIHAEYGGVVPDIARREHEKNIPKVFDEALRKAKVEIGDIDYIAVTYGPGLAIDLEVGINFAKELLKKYNIPVIPVNHMEGHLLSSLLLNSKGSGLMEGNIDKIFPILGLLMSGKHTELIYSDGIGKYEKIGQTLDDAAGEAFDKVGRMLNFGYPGGPVVTEFAKRGKSGVIQFPIPMKNSGDLNFSFSGIKTAALYKSKELRGQNIPEKEWVYDFCRGFVDAVYESIAIKLSKAIEQYPNVKYVLVGGGVFNSEEILRRVGSLVRSYSLEYLYPKKDFRGDNGSMIGLVGYFHMDDAIIGNELEKLDRDPRLSL